MKVVVLHSYYGCDTGCCGHVVRLNDEDGEQIGEFEFTAAGSKEDRKAWAIEFAREKIEREYPGTHTFDLDWDNCDVRDYGSC